MMLKDRCIGVIDLESPELAAFDTRDQEMLTLLASQAAVAIENARLYEAVAASELRLAREVRFAQRVQRALLPPDPPASSGFDEAVRQFQESQRPSDDMTAVAVKVRSSDVKVSHGIEPT